MTGYLPGLPTEAAPPELIDEAVAIMSETCSAGMKAMMSTFAEADRYRSYYCHYCCQISHGIRILEPSIR